VEELLALWLWGDKTYSIMVQRLLNLFEIPENSTKSSVRYKLVQTQSHFTQKPNAAGEGDVHAQRKMVKRLGTGKGI
jgi:hypothetical protein